MENRTTNPIRFVRNASAAVVAGIAGYASYWHQVQVALVAGEHTELAHVIPLSVDGVLVVASIIMVDSRQDGRRPHWVTKFGFAFGIAASVAANVASAQPTLLGRAVAAWPAIALFWVVEMLSRRGKLIDEPSPIAVPTAVVPVQRQAQQVVDQAATVLPVPVSPAPRFSDEDDDEARLPAGSRPIARRSARSPLTGRVLSERPPRV